MAYDPAGAGCLDCPRDLIAVADRTGLAVDVTRTGPGLTAAWALVAVGLLVRRVTTGSPARRRARAGVAAGTAAYLVLVAAAALHTLLDDSQFVDEVARRLRTVEAVALVAVAAAVAWGWARRGRTRARVARLVLDLAALPPPGGLRDALAAGLGDPTLRLGYRLADGRLVAVDGQPVVVAGAATELRARRPPGGNPHAPAGAAGRPTGRRRGRRGVPARHRERAAAGGARGPADAPALVTAAHHRDRGRDPAASRARPARRRPAAARRTAAAAAAGAERAGRRRPRTAGHVGRGGAPARVAPSTSSASSPAACSRRRWPTRASDRPSRTSPTRRP